MFKLIGGGSVFLSCLVLGLFKSYRMKRRCESLSTLLLCTGRIAAETSFSRKRLERIFAEVSREFNMMIFSDAAIHIPADGVKSAWKNSLQKYAESMALTENDIKSAERLGSVGDFTGEEQQKCIRTVERLLELAQNEARADYERTGKLYRSSGVLCGVLAVILLL